MKASLRLLVLSAALSLGLAQVASASNPVVDWNQIALTTALTTPGTQIYLTYCGARREGPKRVTVVGPPIRIAMSATPRAGQKTPGLPATASTIPF
jgi:hypothetical protein